MNITKEQLEKILRYHSFSDYYGNRCFSPRKFQQITDEINHLINQRKVTTDSVFSHVAKINSSKENDVIIATENPWIPNDGGSPLIIVNNPNIEFEVQYRSGDIDQSDTYLIFDWAFEGRQDDIMFYRIKGSK